MTPSTRTHVVVLLLLAVGTIVAVAADTPGPYAYHLRIVRVSGAVGNPGAAMGWTDNGGIPVMTPSEEAWGDPAQLEALAAALGGERADAVTGFFVTGDAAGARFERRIYLEGSIVDLSFDALPPEKGADEHRLTMKLDSPESETPLAEARLLVRTDRTVAIAAPSPVDDDWLVLAVTLADQDTVENLRATNDPVRSSDAPGVTRPEVIHKTEPRYPHAARRDKLQGQVVVSTMIDRQGLPHAPMVIEMSPGAEELAASAVDAVTAWRFRPAMQDGEPIDVYFTVTVKFKLQ